jgi:hypothetical protein
MCEQIPFKAEHINYMLSLNPELHEWIENGNAERTEREGHSITIVVHGTPMVSGGVVKLWDKRGQLWVTFNEDSRSHMVAVFRGMRRFLENSGYDRIEMDQPVGFELGHRRAIALGFELVSPRQRKYYPNGMDAALYAWVRG